MLSHIGSCRVEHTNRYGFLCGQNEEPSLFFLLNYLTYVEDVSQRIWCLYEEHGDLDRIRTYNIFLRTELLYPG